MLTEKLSLTLRKDVVAEARSVVGARGLSSYVNRALERQLQHDRLVGLLDELEMVHGPIDPRTMDEVRDAWSAPETGKARRRSA